jgi:NAD-specific glutamate dehydrogenase
MGKDVDREPFATAGIGDMSGDVFGNGMIASKNIRLQAAFNHLHIFLDPDPDLGAAFDERQRLFQLPSSTWADYDTSRISAGGGVWRRDSKSIELSPRAREVLGVRAESLNGDELVRAILTMPCDLLFNGGIGTYIKASTGEPRGRRRPRQQHRARERQGAARPRRRRRRESWCDPARPDRIRASRRSDQHGLHRQLGRRGPVGPRGEFQDPAGARPGPRCAGPDDRDTVLQAETKTVCEQVLRDNYLQGLILSLEEAKGAGGSKPTAC